MSGLKKGNRKVNVGARERHAIAMALYWWKSKRPLAWTVTRHIGNMTVNCSTPAEQALAKACGNVVIDRTLRKTVQRHVSPERDAAKGGE